MNFPKIILGFYAILFVSITLWAGDFFVQMYRDLTAMKAQETANQHRLDAARRQLTTQEAYLEQLRHDPALVERLIRQKLGYAKGQEFVFRFEENQ